MRRKTHERLFALLFLMFIVGVGFSVYYQSQPFLDHSEEVVRMTGDNDLPKAQVVSQRMDRQKPAEVSEIEDRVFEDDLDMEAQSEGDFFIDARLRRERVRSRQIALLQEIIENQQADEEIRSRAQTTLVQLTEKIEKENEIENFIQAKGFEDCLLFLSENRVDVVVRTEELNENRVEKIGEAVSSKAGIEPSNITVIGREN